MPAEGVPPSREDQLSMVRQSKAARLAEAGKFQCARCRRVFRAKDGILVTFQGNFLVGECIDCFDARPVIMRVVRTAEGNAVEVRILTEVEAHALRNQEPLIAIPNLSLNVRSTDVPASIKPEVETVFRDEGED